MLPESLAWASGTAEDVRRLCDALLELGKSLLADGDHDNCPPQFAVMTRLGPAEPIEIEIAVLHVPFNEAVEKRLALRWAAKRLVAAKKIPIVAALLSEAWHSHQRQGAPYIEPRHNPNRQECLFVMAVDMAGQHGQSGFIPVRRDSKGMMHQDGDAEVHDGFTATLLREFFRSYAEDGMARCGIRILMTGLGYYILGGPHDQDQWRYSTWEEAEAGHEKVVDALKKGLDP